MTKYVFLAIMSRDNVSQLTDKNDDSMLSMCRDFSELHCYIKLKQKSSRIVIYIIYNCIFKTPMYTYYNEDA